MNSYFGFEAIEELFLTNNPETWKKGIAQLMALCESDVEMRFAISVYITKDCITPVMSEMVSNGAAQKWLDLWKQATKKYKEFDNGIEMLEAAVKYKQTGGDRRTLLALPIELRSLVEPLVGWNANESSKSKKQPKK